MSFATAKSTASALNEHAAGGRDTDTDSTLTRNEDFENGNSDREDRGGYGVTFLGSRLGF